MADVTVLNTSSDLSGATVVTKENAYTITGLHTFDRDPSAPFAVSASSAVVPNLDADKVDGYEASALAKLAESPTFTAGPINLNDAATDNAIQLQVSGSTKAAIALSGRIEGNSDTDLAIFAETGFKVKIYANGSATEMATFGSDGLVFPTASHGGGNNCSIGQAIMVKFTAAPTGIAGGVDGRVLFIINNTGGDLILSEEDAASSAANRFGAITGMSIDWRQNGVIQLIYNGTNSRWMVIGTSI